MQEILEKQDRYYSRGNLTEGLKLPVDISKRTAGQFYAIFAHWWDYFNIKGKGLLVGHGGPTGEAAKRFLLKEYEKVTEVLTTDIEREADLMWDITSTDPVPDSGFGFVNSQAMLEHVVDPVQAMRNMKNVLGNEGMIFIHTHGRAFGYHSFPIDCYRFSREVLIAWADLLDMKLMDLWCNAHHVFAAYKKEIK